MTFTYDTCTMCMLLQGKYTVLSQDLFVKVLNWDSRMHSCLNEFLQGKVLKSGVSSRHQLLLNAG